MIKRNTITGVSGLVAVALLAVGCKESVRPGRPSFWVGGAAQLVFTGQPNNATVAPGCAAASGSAISVEVTVVDADGTTITDFVGSVTLAIEHDASAGANATLCGTLTADLVDGVARFTGLGIDQPGDGYTLKATADGAESAVSAPFNITTVKPTTGDLRVRTTTTGQIPASNYMVTVDGLPPQSIAPNGGEVPFNGLVAGSHHVELSGVPANCAVTGNPRDVDVPADVITTTTFDVNCPLPTGGVRVLTTTSGPIPANNYSVTVDALPSRPIAPNGGDVTFDGLVPGSHHVELSGVPTNCTVGGNPRDVDVPSGPPVITTFAVTCTPPHLEFSLQPNSAATRGPNCMSVFGAVAEDNVSTDVMVVDDPGSTVTAVTITIGSIHTGNGTLCPTTSVTVSVGTDHVAHFTGLGINQCPLFNIMNQNFGCTVLSGTYTLTATTTTTNVAPVESATFSISVPI